MRLVGDNIEQPIVMPTRDALRMADEMELDLIEISPKADPPVCRIADYQKFLYQQKKKAKEIKAKQVKVVIKEIRFGPQTDDHDYNFKLKHAQNFLKEGAKVKAYVFFRGRSIVFKRDSAAALRHRPRRARQGGDDAQARRQEDEHDPRAQEHQEVAQDTSAYGPSDPTPATTYGTAHPFGKSLFWIFRPVARRVRGIRGFRPKR